MKKFSTATFGRKFVYGTVLLFFVGGLTLGWASGEYRVRDGNEVAYYRGVYALCMAWALNIPFAPMQTAIQNCSEIMQNGYDLNVDEEPDYQAGFYDPRP